MIQVQGHNDLPIFPLILTYVRKFTRDNKVSIEFDPFGFFSERIGHEEYSLTV